MSHHVSILLLPWGNINNHAKYGISWFRTKIRNTKKVRYEITDQIELTLSELDNIDLRLTFLRKVLQKMPRHTERIVWKEKYM